MREIKFRGIDARYNVEAGFTHNVFRYGNLIICDNGDYVIETDRNKYGQSGLGCKVIAETVGQLTGLKDKNGVEIFEGDIATAKNHGKEVVTFEKGMFKFGSMSLCTFTNVGTEYWCEVIGNIYTHPHLLGSEKE